MRKYEVCYLDADGAQKTGGTFTDFAAAQRNRDGLISQGYEAWIEEVVPAYSGVSP
jgi:hypothetical protein